MKLSRILPVAAALGSLLALSAGPAAGKANGWAVVNSDGTLARGNATSAQHVDVGAYEVDFAGKVKKCAFTATTGLSGTSGSSPAAFVTVAGRNGNANGVYVATFDASGNQADFGFHLNVRC
jgi:hypothetical protein